jgi:hypothetical protein
MKTLLPVVALAAALAASAAGAHHSFAAEYDQNRPVKLTGTVTRFDLANPHSWIHIDVKEANGQVVNWAFETASVSNLFRRGIKKDTVKPDMVVTIEGYQARDTTHTGNAQRLTMPDGSVLVLGSETNPGE